MSHKNVCQSSFVDNISKLKTEILDSSKSLENSLKVRIKHFAYTYGNYKSMSDKSLKIVFKRYDFVYSCLREIIFKI